MANKMTFHESYGELPTPLFHLVRQACVTPAEFEDFVHEGMSFAEIEEAIRAHSPEGYFKHFSWMSERLGW